MRIQEVIEALEDIKTRRGNVEVKVSMQEDFIASLRPVTSVREARVIKPSEPDGYLYGVAIHWV